MKKELIKISNDPIGLNRPYPGPYRDANGTRLNGIYLRQHKNTEDKLFISNGNLMRKYKYPRIKGNFHSPMLSDYNLHLCGGWSWEGVYETECLTRVVQGSKPMGAFITPNREEYEKWLEYCCQSGLPYTYNTENPYGDFYEIDLCTSGKFSEHFDLEAFASDHCEYATCAGYSYFFENITLLTQQLKEKPIADYLYFDYGNPSTTEELIITGLILGYPIETTASILWMQ